MVFNHTLEKSVSNPVQSQSSEAIKMDTLSIRFLDAAKIRDSEALRKCIADGVDINVKDSRNRNNSALHYVLSDDCFQKTCSEKGEKCLKLLLETPGIDPNICNSKEETPLDLVAKNMVPDSMAKLLILHGGSYIVEPNGIKNPGLPVKLVHKMPGVVKDILDQAVQFTSEKPTQKRGTVRFWKTEKTGGRQTPTIEIDLRYISYHKDPRKASEERKCRETEFLHDILTGGPIALKTILPHPVVQAFLELKHPLYWRHFGLYYFIWIILTFSLYLGFIWILYNDICHYSDDDDLMTTNGQSSSTPKYESSTSSSHNGKFRCASNFEATVLAYVILLLYFTGPFWLEFRRLRAIGPNLYVREWKNYVILIASCIVAVTLWPSLSLNDSYELSWQYPMAALGMLVGSLVIFIQLAPITVAALYLEMVFKIFRRIVLATIILSPILLGFFFAFRILLTNKTIGPFKLLTMIVSDNDYEQMMDSDRGVFYSIVAYAFFTAFIILVIIVVLNFLIGLAVSDIQELRESASSSNSIALVRSFYLMDAVYSGRKWNSVIRNGEEPKFRFCPLDEMDTRLSEKLKLELLEIARNRSLPNKQDGKEVKNTSSSHLKSRESTKVSLDP